MVWRYKYNKINTVYDSECKVLGMTWNVSCDQIMFLTELAEQAKNLEPTKRKVISLIGWFYEPLGFLAPMVVRYTIIYVSTMRRKDHLGWDNTKIPHEAVKPTGDSLSWSSTNIDPSMLPRRGARWSCNLSTAGIMPRSLPTRQLSTCGLKLKMVTWESLWWPKLGSHL